jgi:ABC-type amino acid transport/signal transduction systems, periplasmic component/domain
MKSRKSLAVVTAAAAALLFAGCSADTGSGSVAEDCTPAHEFDTVSAGTLTVAVVAVPKLIDIEDGALTGLEGDILTGFAEAECLTVSPQEINGAGIIPAVQQARVDVATGGWAETEERKEVVSFAGPSFIDRMAIISAEGYTSLDELIAAGAIVGSPQGNGWVEDVDAALGANHKIYQSFNETYQDLVAGRIDAAFTTFASSLDFMATDDAADLVIEAIDADDRVGFSLGSLPTAYPVVKDNAGFQKALTAYIEQLRASGELEAILVKWGMPAESAQP